MLDLINLTSGNQKKMFKMTLFILQQKQTLYFQ